jgi:hypothetical protein
VFAGNHFSVSRCTVISLQRAFFLIAILIDFFLLQLVGHSPIVKLVFIFKCVFGMLANGGIELFGLHGDNVEFGVLLVVDVGLVQGQGVAAVRG